MATFDSTKTALHKLLDSGQEEVRGAHGQMWNKGTVIVKDGISNEFATGLNREIMPDKYPGYQGIHYITDTLLNPFGQLGTPLCCTFVGWCSEKHDSKDLEKMMECIHGMGALRSHSMFLVSSVTYRVPGGTIMVAMGAATKEPPHRGADEILEGDFSSDPSIPKQLYEFSYSTFLHGALQNDPLGVIVAIGAAQKDLVNAEMEQAVVRIRQSVTRTSLCDFWNIRS